MDPRQNLSRTSSSHVPHTNYSPVNSMSASYQMPPYQNQTHLPPINYQSLPPTNQQGYMQQQQQPYRNELPRYPSSSAPGPPSVPDRYQPHMTQPNSMQSLPTPMLPQPPNQPPQQGYQGQQQARQNYQQPLAPAPPRPDPMVNNYGHPDGRQPAWAGAESMGGMPADPGRDLTKTHVVGSQGRRGILPSAPGRPPVAPNGLNGSPKGGQLPQKDADGKFPCPNCTKTYLHAKHLKRHMLRHTGDRPYMCVLCNDTFSRSDILKRHFQKCSVRRGNPTGASHLSSPAAHLKKSQAAAVKAAQNASAAAGGNNSGSSTPVSGTMPTGPFTSSMAASNVPATAGPPPPASMAYSMNPGAQGDMQRPPPNQPMQGDPNANNQWAMHNARNPNMMYHQPNNTSDHFDDKRNAMPNAHPMGDEWNQMFPGGTNDQYMNPMFSGYDQSQHDVKNEHHEGGSNGYYIPPTSLGADGSSGPHPSLWSNLSISQEDPIQLKADRLVDFCFPAGIQESLQEQQNNFSIRTCLSVESIKHFLNLYSNFQGHFPWLHLPTFNIFNAYDGLFLTVICSGAVYSDRVTQTQVRALLHRVKDGINRTAVVLRHLDGPLPRFSPSGAEHDELLSMHMLSNLLIWHGGPEEREAARNDSRAVQSLTRRYGLLRLAGPDDSRAYSYLHNLGPGEQADPARWNWYAWVEQEKRLRLMYLVFSFDAALCMYFNMEPTFSASEVTLPMPCDDAAWEAADAETCAQALGLRGPALQVRVNTSGSLRLKSLECHHAMQALHSPAINIQPRTTNVYSKFVLIHALHAEIWHLQRQRSVFSSPMSPRGRRDDSGQDHNTQLLQKSISTALTKWKQCWDEDMMLQYPPSSGNDTSAQRVGFCRDGVQFYWLAKAFLQPNRMHDWQLPAEKRFRLVMRGLSMAREWSVSDGARRGEEPGSVALIDDDYVTPEPLILDMRKLMKPLGIYVPSSTMATMRG